MDGNPMQQAALQQLGAVPGVVGSMVFERSGRLLAAAFPPVFDAGGLAQLATQLTADGYFQEWLAGDRAQLDLRFADGHVLVRGLDGAWLLVLCTAESNAQLLSMSLTQVARRLRGGGAVGTRTGEHAVVAQPPEAAPSAADRLAALIRAELGTQASQALEIVAAAGTSPAALRAAVEEVEQLVRLFINRKKAEAFGRRMREIVAA